jgi:hypothetical protein
VTPDATVTHSGASFTINRWISELDIRSLIASSYEISVGQISLESLAHYADR